MKVLIVNKFLYPNGGSETYIFQIAECLQRMGHEVQFFGMEHEGRIVGNHAECYTNNMDFHTGKLQKLLYPLKIIYSKEAKKKMLYVLEDFKPDVVHLNNFNFQLTPSIIYAIKKYEKKNHVNVELVYTAHDYQWVCPNHMMKIPSSGALCDACLKNGFKECVKNRCIHNSRLRSILGQMEANLYKKLKTYRYIDTIICPSEFLKRQMDSNPLFSQKTIAIHNFIDKKERIEDSKERYVLYFGRFSEEKGMNTLLQVCKELPQVQFIFAGKGEFEEEINSIPNIKNVGFITGDSLISIIQKAEFSVFTSEWYENCPFSVMESQMYGTPIIASDLGGTPELVQNGKTGILYEGKNKDALKTAIEKLWSNKALCEEYQQNCQNVDYNSLNEYCEELLKIYVGKSSEVK